MDDKIAALKNSRGQEYIIVAEKRLDVLKELLGLREFDGTDYYKVSARRLLEANEGKLSLSHLELVHPDRAALNKAIKALVKDGVIEKFTQGIAVYIRLIKQLVPQQQ